MRTEAEIRQKLKQVQFRHLKKLLEANFKQRPCNCAHNEVHQSLNGSGDPIGLCMYGSENPEEWEGVICDEAFGGITLARNCGTFKPHKTKIEIKAEFNALMENEDLGVIAAQYPDVAALLWTLGERGYTPTLWQRFLWWYWPAHVLPMQEGTPDEGPDQS